MSELPLNRTQKNLQVRTDKGETLETDLIICCTGIRVNSGAYASSLGGSTGGRRGSAGGGVLIIQL